MSQNENRGRKERSRKKSNRRFKKPIIIFSIGKKQLRFGQLAARMELISRKVLTEQLKELEEDGILIRKAYNEIPPRVEYHLSEKGLDLLPILQQMCNWNKKHAKRATVCDPKATKKLVKK